MRPSIVSTDHDTLPPGPTSIPPSSEAELQIFGEIVRNVVREEQGPLKASIATLSDQVLELTSRQQNHDRRGDIQDQRLEKLETKRVRWPAGLALVALGIAMGNAMTIMYILSRLL